MLQGLKFAAFRLHEQRTLCRNSPALPLHISVASGSYRHVLIPLVATPPFIIGASSTSLVLHVPLYATSGTLSSPSSHSVLTFLSPLWKLTGYPITLELEPMLDPQFLLNNGGLLVGEGEDRPYNAAELHVSFPFIPLRSCYRSRHSTCILRGLSSCPPRTRLTFASKR
ncbi:hypothetical protein M405DRAFT_819149 [Rhizopogon salebrosus TDB-379]|nr:hypothetical protein M405DRAFT_819149 [Rhizopogon salebrosus TDB-379]